MFADFGMDSDLAKHTFFRTVSKTSISLSSLLSKLVFSRLQILSKKSELLQIKKVSLLYGFPISDL